MIKTITVGAYGDLFDPVNSYVYVANMFSGSVSAINDSKLNIII